MKPFTCGNCGQTVHFDNLFCENCGASLAFNPETVEMIAFDESSEHQHQTCSNRKGADCNWLVPSKDVATSSGPEKSGGIAQEDAPSYCASCQLNLKVPDLSDPDNIEKWKKLEAAKRAFLYGLIRLHLPITTRVQNPENGLAFQLLSDEGLNEDILTGHDNGLITINIAEADDAEREATREAMGEDFRTLLGHFRHETGHYYWNMLIRDQGAQEQFRDIFGDERQNYAQSLETHYSDGPVPNWQDDFISAYASCHPWEDFAESWAHYMHIIDGVETAYRYGLWPSAAPAAFDPYEDTDFDKMIAAWVSLSLAVNAINRSVGQQDVYPFVFSPRILAKLNYIHSLSLNAALTKK